MTLRFRRRSKQQPALARCIDDLRRWLDRAFVVDELHRHHRAQAAHVFDLRGDALAGHAALAATCVADRVARAREVRFVHDLERRERRRASDRIAARTFRPDRPARARP